MRILLDCRPLQLAGSNSEKYEIILSAVAALSGDKAVEWLLLVDHNYLPGLLPGLVPDQPEARPSRAALPSDRTHVLTSRSLPGPLGWKLWYDWQLPRLVKRHKPDLLMLTGGVTAKPSGARQYVWMPVFANPKEAAAMEAGPIVPIYGSRLGNSVRQAEMTFCFSEKDRSWLAGRGHIDAVNILVVRPAPSPGIQPLSVNARETIKQRYTGGKEYFFVPAAGAGAGAAAEVREEQIIQLLKAFSLFKKRQLSNLQLVLAGAYTESLRERLGTYKYRNDIHWVDALRTGPDAAPGPGMANPNDIISAAYAVLFPFEDGTLGTALLNAWKAAVPALVARTSRLLEMVDDAAVIAGVDDPAALAGYMMSVYKDETGRNTLITKGTARLAEFDPPPSLAVIQTVVGREINKIN